MYINRLNIAKIDKYKYCKKLFTTQKFNYTP